MKDRGLISTLEGLISESRNPGTMNIDLLSTLEILQEINREDTTVPGAVRLVLPEIAEAVERIIVAFNAGARLIYIGAGTSGRLGVLDASECPPTFGVPQDMVIGIIAGGPSALMISAEGAEDAQQQGGLDLQDIRLDVNDVVVGIAVSGRTPYVIGGLNYANKIGATTVALSCNPSSVIAGIADIAITPVVGPEVLSGSTRLKSGTAQKLVLNMLTTASMIRIGKIYQNLMVDLNASNEKLLARATGIVVQATDCSTDAALKALTAADNNVKLAILIVLTGLDADAAKDVLKDAGGFLRTAIKAEAG
ncbi:MAG: N-acetylmuramic acid 6-phosphate etherase [Paracoccaceae bacterium]